MIETTTRTRSIRKRLARLEKVMRQKRDDWGYRFTSLEDSYRYEWSLSKELFLKRSDPIYQRLESNSRQKKMLKPQCKNANARIVGGRIYGDGKPFKHYQSRRTNR